MKKLRSRKVLIFLFLFIVIRYVFFHEKTDSVVNVQAISTCDVKGDLIADFEKDISKLQRYLATLDKVEQTPCVRKWKNQLKIELKNQIQRLHEFKKLNCWDNLLGLGLSSDPRELETHTLFQQTFN